MLLPRLRLLLRGAYAFYLGCVLLLLGAPAWLLVAIVPNQRFARAVGRMAAGLALRLGGCRLEVHGLANLAGAGPFLLASNHASYIDVPVLMALLPLPFAFVAKREVLGWPLVGTFVRRAGHLTVERWDTARSVADAGHVARRTEEGESIMVFPEGTFVAATGLRPFRLGVFKTAVETGTPVAPLALRGTRQVLRAETLLPRPGRIELWIGTPIAPTGGGWRAVVELRDRVAAAIAAQCGEPVLDLVAGGPERPVAG
jgi:1-acyl-sn-glycerol-3-phosphate acyltransferase